VEYESLLAESGERDKKFNKYLIIAMFVLLPSFAWLAYYNNLLEEYRIELIKSEENYLRISAICDWVKKDCIDNIEQYIWKNSKSLILTKCGQSLLNNNLELAWKVCKLRQINRITKIFLD